jgi:hypothetical protein
MANKVWEMNAVQKEFVELVKANPDGVTLFELKLEGKEYKTGALNTLIKKGILINAGEKEFQCDVVYNGKKVGTVKKTAAIYKLA